MGFYSCDTISSSSLCIIEDKKTGTRFQIWNPVESKIVRGYRIVYRNLNLSIAERIIERLKSREEEINI